MIEQSRRHAFIATLLGIPHMVVCVNKMDLVDWSQERFDEIRDGLPEFAMRLEVHDVTFIPMSALIGDNVVDALAATWAWYDGAPLLHHLENVYIASDRNLIDARFPVQYVIRPQTPPRTPTTGATPARWPAGCSSPATRWSSCPSGFTSTDRVDRHRGRRGAARRSRPMAVTITLEPTTST